MTITMYTISVVFCYCDQLMPECQTVALGGVGGPRALMLSYSVNASLCCVLARWWHSVAWAPSGAPGHAGARRGAAAAAQAPEPSGRRAALSLAGLALAAGAPSPSEASNGGALWSTDKFDGSFTDDKYPCEDCTRTINADGGFGNIRGRDSQGGDMWTGLIEYSNKDVVASIVYADEEKGEKKLKGTWFSKKGEKGIKWNDGSVWTKMDYKIAGG
ncbi:unnamed protein product [Prorocentrum cordatum]|uniref:Uncharacterized protein n=1 Tax=Prorocentrum cordatum TaxID=2364126 RepID=A0ABN9WJL4_9DINO|nr:unnamed protein product [Polarella glacialis]